MSRAFQTASNATQNLRKRFSHVDIESRLFLEQIRRAQSCGGFARIGLGITAAADDVAYRHRAVFGGMLLLRFVLLYLRAGKLPTWFLMILLVVAGAVVWQQLGTVIGREGGISFLLLMIMLKAFEGRVMRDWQVLLLSMLFLVGSAVLFPAKSADRRMAAVGFIIRQPVFRTAVPGWPLVRPCGKVCWPSA